MPTSDNRSFSTFWLVVSIVLFCTIEIVIGGYVGPVLLGKFVSRMLLLKMEVLLNLGSYFLGGILIGVITPGVRIYEPAVGAAVSVFLALAISIFLPHSFLHLSVNKVLIGGGIGFFLAFAGARIGERFMGNIKEDEGIL